MMLFRRSLNRSPVRLLINGALGLTTALTLASCAHSRSVADKDPSEITPTDAAALKQEGPVTTNDLDDSGRDLNAIPTEVNRLVLEWIDYFQGRGREHMERYLARSTRYLPMMKAVLRKQGLPEDLVYIALIESGFSPSARSFASAVGYWQFIRPTGKAYGLQIDSYVDERRDFVRSTEAAADYFKSLYNLFGSWYLAIASYNVGENRIKNVVMKYHTRDFWQMSHDRKLPLETIHYIPKFMAARMIAKEPEKYGFTNISYEPPLDYSEIQLTQSVDLKKMAEEMSLDPADLKELNPMYKKGIAVDHNGKLTLRVPRGTEDKATVAAATSVVTDRKAFAAADEDDVSYYRVHRGESISTIAHKFHISSRKLRAINEFTSRTRLVAGRKIKVPNDSTVGVESPRTAKTAANATKADRARRLSRGLASSDENLVANGDSSKSDDAKKVHVVKRGETLLHIAHRYNVSISRLAAQNQIGRRTKIMVGSRLLIPD